MTKSEAVIRMILGPTRADIRPLARAVDVAEELMFVKGIPMDDILVTKQIYPEAARRLGKSTGSTARRIERLANKCWDEMDDDLMDRIIHKRLRDSWPPCNLIYYLAYYVHFDKPFYDVIDKDPALLF